MTVAGFSWPLALKLINASICAYQIRAKGVGPDSAAPILRTVQGPGGTCCYDVVPVYQDAAGFPPAKGGYAPVFTARGDDDIDACLAGVTACGHAVLAFRGTLPPNLDRNDLIEWLLDWINDACAEQVPWPPTGPPIGKLEAGFAAAVEALWPWIEETLPPLLARAPRGLLITGHSKGAAMTYCAASLALARWPELSGRIGVYAFASPVAGDAAFAASYDALAPATHRVQVAEDIVPFLPRWDAADIWTRIRFTHLVERLAWAALVDAVDRLTGTGYSAVGDLTLIAADGSVDQSSKAADRALDVVVAALTAERFAAVGAAHAAAANYLPKIAAAAAGAVTAE